MLFIVEYRVPTDRSIRWQDVEAESEDVARGIVMAMFPMAKIENVIHKTGWIRER